MSFHPGPLQRIAPNVRVGHDVKIYDFVNLDGCCIGEGSRIGTFVEIQKGVTIGARCRISSHTFIGEGVTIEDECFIGHHVCFVNDPYPRSTTADERMQSEKDWQQIPTRVCRTACIGSGAVVLRGVTIGAAAVIEPGAVVSKDVAPGQVVAGVPVRGLRFLHPAESAS